MYNLQVTNSIELRGSKGGTSSLGRARISSSRRIKSRIISTASRATCSGLGVWELDLRVSDLARSKFHGSGVRVRISEFRVQGSGFRAQDSGFGLQSSGLRVQGSGSRAQDSGFRVFRPPSAWSYGVFERKIGTYIDALRHGIDSSRAVLISQKVFMKSLCKSHPPPQTR